MGKHKLKQWRKTSLYYAKRDCEFLYVPTYLFVAQSEEPINDFLDANGFESGIGSSKNAAAKTFDMLACRSGKTNSIGIYLSISAANQPSSWIVSFLSHEVCHAVNYAFGWRGLKLDLDNDEAQCYYHQMLMLWVMETLGISNSAFDAIPLRLSSPAS